MTVSHAFVNSSLKHIVNETYHTYPSNARAKNMGCECDPTAGGGRYPWNLLTSSQPIQIWHFAKLQYIVYGIDRDYNATIHFELDKELNVRNVNSQ
jgi:hypothetical protein